MRKIVFIGAGSGFGQRLCNDILAHEDLQDCHLALVDINERRLEAVTDCVEQLIEKHDLPATVEATADREEVMEAADYVIIAVAIGGPAYDGVPYYHEINIPKQYGIYQEVADTVGPGGVFRTLRSAPEMMAIARDVQRFCPKALVLNYTNPMAALTWVMNEAAPIRLVGLCHSVQGTAGQLAGYMGVPHGELRYWVAGINHMSWFLELKRHGQDMYPRLRQVMDDPEIWKKDSVRFEILRHFDYFVTESTRHMSEYVPYFRKTREQMEQLGLQLRQPNEVAVDHRWEWLQDIKQQLMESEEHQLKPSGEYASHIIHAIETNQPFRFNGNVINGGLISNLPPECCVEVPCLVDGTGVRPCAVGALPTHLAALNMTNVAVQKLMVEACLAKSRQKAYYATALDPLTAGQCNLDQIRAMFDEMWEAEQPWLQEYK